MKIIYIIMRIIASALSMTAAVLWYINGDAVLAMLFVIVMLLVLKE